MLAVINSMPMMICNRFHEKMANNGKITTFTRVPLSAQVSLNLKKSKLGPSKSTFNAENFICSLQQLISAQFALEMRLAARNGQKTIKTLILAFKGI